MIRNLKPSERTAFVELMYDAFKNDPLFLHVFGDADLKKNQKSAFRFLSALFYMNFYLGGRPKGLFENNELRGCLLLEPVQTNKIINIFMMMKSLIRFMPVLIFLPSNAAKLLNDYSKQTKKAAPNIAHTYLTMIGVHPLAQGHGFGRLLIENAIYRTASSPTAIGIALDTEEKSNVVLYQKFGFKLTSKININGIDFYCMFKKS